MITIPENYQKITDLKIMQNMLRDLMYEMHCICEQHGLVYNIFGGTLLGAVRHQDIIPWDDDIDITMPRTDYEKLINIVNEQYADSFEIHAYPRKNYVYPYGKFCRKDTILVEKGLRKQYSESKLYVDIFPMDGVPNMPDKKQQKRYAYAERNKKLAYYCAGVSRPATCWWKRPFTFVKYLRLAVANIWGYEYFLKNQIKETTKYTFDDSDYVGFVSSWGWGQKGIIAKEDYFDRVLYKFGGYEFWGTRDYDTSLSGWYGDYMTPPPVDKRTAAHNYDLYVEVVDRK